MKRLHSLAAFAALLTLAACSNEEGVPSSSSSFPADGVIRIAATVEESATTRAGMTTDNIETFNLQIVNPVNSNYSYYAYCYGSGSEWLYYKEDARTLQTLLWQNNTQPITVTAVSLDGTMLSESGFKGLVSCNIQSDQSSERFLKKSDWLYMPPTEIDPATDLIDGKLPITFKHLFSKVHLTVKLGTEFNAATNPITGLKVNGTIRNSLWKPSTNSAFDFTGFGPESITPFAATYTAGNGTTSNALARYECILLPQTVAAGDFSVSFTLGGKDYTWTSAAAVILAHGTAYDLALTVGTATTTRSAAAAGDTAAVTGILSASQTWNK